MRSNFVMLGVNLGTVDDHLLIRRAILVYAAYCATNQARHIPHSINAETADGMLQQNAKHAACHHTSVALVIDSGYVRPAASRNPTHEQLFEDVWNELEL